MPRTGERISSSTPSQGTQSKHARHCWSISAWPVSRSRYCVAVAISAVIVSSSVSEVTRRCAFASASVTGIAAGAAIWA